MDDNGACSGYLFLCSSGARLTDFKEEFWSNFFFSACIMLLCASVLTSFLMRKLTDPLQKITDAAQRFGGGDLSVFLPMVVLLIAAFLSFSTGTAWGTFGILIPIVVPVVQGVDPNLTIVVLSATLAGSVFGDHCSPISDTTILSSAGAGCNHIEHVATQLPYALVVAACSAAGYLVAGLTGGNLWLSLGTAFLMMIAVTCFLHFRQVKLDKRAEAEAQPA